MNKNNNQCISLVINVQTIQEIGSGKH